MMAFAGMEAAEAAGWPHPSLKEVIKTLCRGWEVPVPCEAACKVGFFSPTDLIPIEWGIELGLLLLLTYCIENIRSWLVYVSWVLAHAPEDGNILFDCFWTTWQSPDFINSLFLVLNWRSLSKLKIHMWGLTRLLHYPDAVTVKQP